MVIQLPSSAHRTFQISVLIVFIRDVRRMNLNAPEDYP